MKYAINILFLLLLTQSVAQRKNIITVTLNTESGEFSDEDHKRIPFDEKYRIIGEFKTEDISSIKLKYRILGYCKNEPIELRKKRDLKNCDEDTICEKQVYQDYFNELIESKCDEYSKSRHYYLYDKLEPDGYVHLDIEEVKNKHFSIYMDRMHPNEIYELHFSYLQEVVVDNKVQKIIKKSVVSFIDGSYGYKREKISYDDFEPLNDKIWKEVIDGVEQIQLFDSNGNPVSKDISSNRALKRIFRETVEGQNAVRRFYNRNIRYLDDPSDDNNTVVEVIHIMNLINNMRSDLIKAYERLLTDDFFKEKLKEPINRLEDDKFNYQDMVSLLREDYGRWDTVESFADAENSSNSYLLEILMGRAKIGKSDIEKSDFFDLRSGKLLSSFFSSLTKIYGSDDKPIFNNVNIINLIALLSKWNKEVEDIIPEYLKTEMEIEKIPSLYEGYFLQNVLIAEVPTIEVLESRESRYLGIDFGIMYAPDIESTFVFEGINFHFRPVNRRAKFSKLKGWDRFLKQFSIFAGIAQRVGNYNDKYEKLIGVGSPFFGGGIRINSVLRLNAGALFYEEANINPVISDSNTNMTYFFSVSVDAKLRDVFELITGKLN